MILPDVSLMKPSTKLASVVFPLPLSPAMVVMVAGDSSIVRLKLSSATTVFLLPPMNPPEE